MSLSKFVVYIVLVLELRLGRTQTGSPLGNWTLQRQGSTGSDDLAPPLSMDAVELLQRQMEMPMATSTRSSEVPEVKSGRKANDDDDDDDFRFLITGGYRPEKNDLVKFVVSVRTNKERKFFGDNHFCGGAIIAVKVILTAAHCLFVGTGKLRARKVVVVAGTPRRLVRTDHTQVMSVEKVRPHPKYSARRLINDIGLLKLKESIKIDGTFVDIIPLANTDPVAGVKCTVVGWGTVIQYGPTPDEAVNGDMTVRKSEVCNRIEGFTKGMLCASDENDYEVDSCQGDSGGPLICEGKLTGVVSYGFGCGEPDSSGVYTNAYYFRTWINDNSAFASHHTVEVCCLLLVVIHRL